MEPYSQEPATGPYPKPNASPDHTFPHYLPLRPILSSNPCLGLFPSGSATSHPLRERVFGIHFIANRVDPGAGLDRRRCKQKYPYPWQEVNSSHPARG